ncbi:hypothetical protein OUZ56_001581 [Daphnia magna]|uniref:Uncharacterized protein n=1 Tax=Daphnia magna TaxID=35525 RepID=A0ABR0A336_9CRUS|nr:hypothetical protein OUZ56_001581 [Daphnia magna]
MPSGFCGSRCTVYVHISLNANTTKEETNSQSHQAKEEKKKQNNCVITRKRCIAFGSRSCSEGYRRCRSKRNGQREQLLSVRPAHQHRRHKTHSKKGNGLETSDGSTVKRIASSISWLQYLRKSRQSHQRHKKRYSGFSPCHLKLLPVVCIPAIMHCTQESVSSKEKFKKGRCGYTDGAYASTVSHH